jgi:signal transduction histidine kinase/CheY-like chemotaxis protein
MSALLLSLLAQGAGALFLVAVLVALSAARRRAPYLYWAAAWLCFALWLALGALGLWWHVVFPGRTGWEHGLLYSALVCGWWHPALWACGAAGYRRGHFPAGLPPALLAGATAAALACASLSWPWRNAALAAATAAAYAGSAAVFAGTWRHRRDAGDLLLTFVLGAWAAERLAYAAVMATLRPTEPSPAHLDYLGFVGLLFQALTGAGVVLALLHEEGGPGGAALDRRRLDRELREQAERLREADRHRTEFLAVLGHELRNPLAALRAGVEVLRSPNRPATEQAVGALRRQLAQLTGLVDDLLDAARINRGRFELRREAVDLAEVVGRAVESARPPAEARGQRLEVALPAGPCLLEGDRVRLVQVFSNLLHNAVKYTDPGGHITVRAEWAGEEAVVRVRDNGVGIAPALLPRLFELFVQGDRSAARAQGGLGIGLALVKRLVELHGGAVEAHSAGVSQGSEFVVRLPRRPPPPVPAPVAAAPAGPSRRVLVVDDNADAALMLTLLLRARGHEVRAAHSGPAALEAAVAFRPEAVVLDIGLPGMDGYEVARRLRTLPELAGALLVALTGYAQEEDRRRARAAGFNQYLIKPVEPDVLYQAVASRQ